MQNEDGEDGRGCSSVGGKDDDTDEDGVPCWHRLDG